MTFMRILVAGVSAELQYVKSQNSFYGLRVQDGDYRTFDFGKPGIHARRKIGSLFERKTQYDALLLCDMDMKFPEDALESMRARDVDMVTGHYFRRRTNPMLSVVQIERDGWPYVPMIDVPDEGLHEVASTGMGCVLIKREVYTAVKDGLPKGGHPFNEAPLPWLTGDYAHFGQDVAFFAQARRLGYKLWLDASVECAHGHTMWLTKKLYDQLGHKDEQLENWTKLFAVSREKNGMDKKTAKIRIEQLEMARKEVADELARAEERVAMLTNQLAVADGQIAEREMDKQQRDYPPGAKPVPLPITGSELAQDLALANRTKPPKAAGTEEELKESRQEVYEREAKQRIEALEDEE